MSAPDAQVGQVIAQAVEHARCGRRADALQAARCGLELQPSAPALLSNLGSIFSAAQEFPEALVCFERAVAASPANGLFRYHLATAQRALGRMAEAEHSCDEAIRLDHRLYRAYWLRSGLRTQTRTHQHVHALEAELATQDTRGEAKVFLCYALAKELEDLEDYARSFEILQLGARTYRESLRYDLEADLRVIRCIVDLHSSGRLRSTSKGYPDAAPIFVVGLPRSGTTLIERCIQSHTGVISLGERNDFALVLTQMTNAAARSELMTRERRVRIALELDMTELGRRYVESMKPAQDLAARRVLDKMPVNYLYCGLIHAALPNARIVSVRRDAMDSCFAAYKTFLEGPYGFTFDLDELGRYYLEYDALMRHWRNTLPRNAYLEVRYEDFVDNFRLQAERLLQFLGLPWQESVLQYFNSATPTASASAAQVRRPVYASSVGKWRHYRAQLEPLARRLGELAHVTWTAIDVNGENSLSD